MKRFACKVLEGEWKGGNGREGDRVGQVRDSQASRRSWPATAWWWYRQAANNGHDDEDSTLPAVAPLRLTCHTTCGSRCIQSWSRSHDGQSRDQTGGALEGHHGADVTNDWRLLAGRSLRLALRCRGRMQTSHKWRLTAETTHVSRWRARFIGPDGDVSATMRFFAGICFACTPDNLACGTSVSSVGPLLLPRGGVLARPWPNPQSCGA